MSSSAPFETVSSYVAFDVWCNFHLLRVGNLPKVTVSTWTLQRTTKMSLWKDILQIFRKEHFGVYPKGIKRIPSSERSDLFLSVVYSQGLVKRCFESGFDRYSLLGSNIFPPKPVLKLIVHFRDIGIFLFPEGYVFVDKRSLRIELHKKFEELFLVISMLGHMFMF